MYDAVRGHFALSASFVLECFDGSEVTTREGNEVVLQKENCVVEEIKEVELRSRTGKLIYNRTYSSTGLNQVSHFSQRSHAPSRLPMNKNTESDTFLFGRVFGKTHNCRLKFIVTLKIKKVYT